MEKWLIVSNCQTMGLVNSMDLLTNKIEVVGLDIWQYGLDFDKNNASLSNYDHVVVIPEIMTWPGIDLSKAHKVSKLPFLHFAAYHPDLVYVLKSGVASKGPLEDYHSMIVFAAFMQGFSVDRTLGLFNRKVYERCGYMSQWVPQRDAAIGNFGSVGIDISRQIRRWGRNNAFMYSVNHPRIHVLYDIARAFLDANGIETHGAESLPHDNLAIGQIFPVYPEIGEQLGVHGSIQFKRAMCYEQLSLRQFVTQSFEHYSKHDKELLTVPVYDQARLDHVRSVLEEH